MLEREITAQIQKIEEQKRQLEERLVTMRTKKRKQGRYEDTKKKILIGAYFMEKYKNKMDELVPQLDRFLVRDVDRELFGLAPKNGSSHQVTE